MPQINILSPHLADLIAAGEVVERPASVIKELMENAFDAGASHVTVEIRNGGATMIRVTDDGCGMAPEDAGIAFLRHATSKLRDEHGLEAIRTMGFRGEALAAISAVSRIELITRRPEDAEGTRMTLLAGEIQDMESFGCPSGTEICVQDLFYNTPARLKFLKTDRSEASACIQAGLRCALGRPEISVRFLRDGKEEFFTPGDGDRSACCYALLGRDLAADLLPVHSEDDGLSINGYISSPAAGRGNRSAQYFFVNGRYIRSQLLQSALEQAYRNTLLTGRYPACVIWLEIRPGSVDVNVHPAKTEVKFSEERRVFSLLHQAAQDTLLREDRTGSTAGMLQEEAPAPAGQISGETVSAAFPAPSVAQGGTVPSQDREVTPAGPSRFSSPTASPQHAFQQTLFAGPVSEYAIINTHPVSEDADLPAPVSGPADNPVRQSGQGAGSLSAPPVSVPSESASPQVSALYPDRPAAFTPAPENSDQASPQEEVRDPDPGIPAHRILGEAFRTYIIVEVDDRVLLIDKHAAHERMNFDRLRARSQPMPAQQLLMPKPIRLAPQEMALAEQFGELLSDFGFELEVFGEGELILRAAPADIRLEDAVPALEEILEHLSVGGLPDPAAAYDEVLHTVACKAAIKAGWDTGSAEQERLAVEVLSGRIRYCPHGRPVSVTVTRKDLDRLFKRIV